MILGAADSKEYAQAEALADYLVLALPQFKVRKVLKRSDEWSIFADQIAIANTWTQRTSPIIYRQLGKGSQASNLIGSLKDFQSLIKEWYGIEYIASDGDIAEAITANVLLANTQTSSFSKAAPFTLCIAGAYKSEVCYTLLEKIFRLKELENKSVEIRLLDSEENLSALKAVVFEMEDCLFPNFKNASATADMTAAFLNVDLAILFQEQELGSEMKFMRYAQALSANGNQSVKVVVIGDDASSLAGLLSKTIPTIPSENISYPVQLSLFRAKDQIVSFLNIRDVSSDLRIKCNDIEGVYIWGEDGQNSILQTSYATVVASAAITGQDIRTALALVVRDNEFLLKTLSQGVRERTTNLIKYRPSGPGQSLANAISEHLRYIIQPQSGVVSMGVMSEGWYGVERGLFFAFPVVYDPIVRKWRIQQVGEIEIYF